MQREKFVASRMERWQRFESLLKRAGRSHLGRLSGEELFEFGQVYRVITSDLAVAQRDFPHDRVTMYLNGLVGRAHPLVYQEGGTGWKRAGRLIRYGFPAAFRRAAPYIAISAALFVISSVVSAGLVWWHPSLADVLLPGEAQDLRSVMSQHHLWVKANTANHSVASSFIVTNNISVAFFAFAGGALAGLGTCYVEITNGISIGAVAAMTAQFNLGEQLLSFVLPHGVIELSVIVMAGGGGLMVGDAILRPGERRRRDAIPEAARCAGVIALGCAALLIICGTIEGFFSASDAPDPLKWAVGALTGILLYSYLFLSRPKVRKERYTLEQLLGKPDQEDAGSPEPDLEDAQRQEPK